MSHRRSITWFARRVCLAGVVAVAVGFLSGATPAAEPLQQIGASLQWVPDDAAFYSSMFRNGEQIEAIGKSRAWASLMNMPAVKEGIKQLRAQITQGDKAEQFKAVWENPEVRKALDTLCDMFSHEIFLYGDKDAIDFLALMQELNAANRVGRLFATLKNPGERRQQQRVQATVLLETLADNIELLKVPGLVIGFRVEDPDRAKEELTKLEMMVNMALIAAPKLSKQVKRVKVDGSRYLTLSLDGSLVPWDQVPTEALKNFEAKEGDADKVIAAVKKLTLVVALGVRNEYVLLSIGPSTEPLARLGKGKALVSRPEFKPLEKFAKERLVGVGYLSKETAARLMANASDIDEMVKTLNEELAGTELSDELKAEVRKDSAALANDLKPLLPTAGATMSFQFLTGRGMEGYRYTWSAQAARAELEPLTLLKHVGGSPLLMLVDRSRLSVDEYDLLVRWIKVGYRYFKQYGLPAMDASEQEEYQQAATKFLPLLERLHRANRELLLPALADGQAGFVLDAKLKSKQFLRDLPATQQAMPMVEPALVVGVSNAELLRKAMGEYRQILNASLEAARELAPGEVPDFSLPEPQVAKTASGTLYWYALPEELGVDKQIKVVMGLSDDVALLAASQRHAERLLKATPLKLGGVLAAADRPRATAFGLNWAALVDAATPWVEFAAREIIKEQFGDVAISESLAPAKAKAKKAEDEKGEKQEEDQGAAFTPRAIMDQVRTVLKVLKVLRAVTVETRIEGDAVVTHSLVEIRDIE